MLEVAQLGPAGLDGQIAAPEKPPDTDRLEAGLEHAAIHPTAREIHVHVGQAAQHRQREEPVAPATDVREQKADGRVPLGELAELAGIGGLLPRIVAPAVLPDVLQDGDAAVGGEAADRIQQTDRWRGGWPRA